MNKKLKEDLLNHTNAIDVIEEEIVQELWSGYGTIKRVTLSEGHYPSVIVKEITPPKKANHPRGWNTNASHQRKLRSYEVEMAWYASYSKLCTEGCRVPEYYFSNQEDGMQIVIEDLDSVGYHLRKQSVNRSEIEQCLSWLANFHAVFMKIVPRGLWEVGTYWHLETRREEFDVMEEGKLKSSASALDDILNECNYQTFVHGDAKLANFCFSEDGQVAAVDFQYVGGGCGMKDVTYFIGSCLNEDECRELEEELLAVYFRELKKALEKQELNLNFNAIEKEWRNLYPIAWTDFTRFLVGWSPSHGKLNNYSAYMMNRALALIEQ